MADQASLDQIIAELSAKRSLKPWEMVSQAPQIQPAAVPSPAPAMATPDPMALAAQRQQIQQGLAPYGAMANPESQSIQGGQPGKSLISLLMSLMGK